ncbi:MAG: flagellar export chaperone FliS [Planctomycetota bacterium]
MTDATANANAYLRTKVMGAKPEELRLLLIEGAMKFAIQAKTGLENKDYEASFNGFGQCRDIVTELMTSVKSDEAPELAERIRSFYAFVYTELIDASFQRDIEKVAKVIDLLEFEAETWRLACEKMKIERANNPALGGGATGSAAAAPAPAASPMTAACGGGQERAPLSIQA